MTDDSLGYINGNLARQPLFTFYLSLFKFLFGLDFYVTASALFQVCLGCLTAYAVARVLTINTPLSLLSLILIQGSVVTPYLVVGNIPLQIMTEGFLFPAFWLVLTLYCLGIYFDKDRYLYCAYIIVLLGCLTKSYFAIMIILMGLLYLMDILAQRRVSKRGLVHGVQLLVLIPVVFVSLQVLDRAKNYFYNDLAISSTYTGRTLLPLFLYPHDGDVASYITNSPQPIQDIINDVGATARERDCTVSASYYINDRVWISLSATAEKHYEICYDNIIHRILSQLDLSKYLPELPPNTGFNKAPVETRAWLESELVKAEIAILLADPLPSARQIKVNLSRGHDRGSQLIVAMIFIAVVIAGAGYLLRRTLPLFGLLTVSVFGMLHLVALATIIFLHGRYVLISDTIFLAVFCCILVDTYLNNRAWQDFNLRQLSG